MISIHALISKLCFLFLCQLDSNYLVDNQEKLKQLESESVDNFDPNCEENDDNNENVNDIDLENPVVTEENKKIKLGKGVSRVSSRIKK